MVCLGYESDVWLQDSQPHMHHTDRSHRQYRHT